MRPLMPVMKKAGTIAALALLAGALGQQLRRPPSLRSWQGKILGIPYDFRPPTLARLRAKWWNPDDPSLFTPHSFGVGWSLNLYRLAHPEQPANTDA